MNIVFLCGSLEAGRDGVGDYVVRLAVELVKRGHEVAAIALNDKFISLEEDSIQFTENVNLSVLRLPSIWAAEQRFLRAAQWIDSRSPDWLSLQFVPYSFHEKGMPFRLAKNLSKLGGNYQWHIMFHELWLDKPDNYKQYLISAVQRLIIYQCIRKLRPTCVNVSIPFNSNRLLKFGVRATVLELFGNISKPIQGNTFLHFSEEVLSTCKVLYFGGAPRGGFLKQIIEGLVRLASSVNKKVTVIVVSGTSAHKAVFLQSLHESLNEYDTTIIDYNFLESDELSSLISLCDVGIVRSEPYLLGKSGSAIAMLEHGLPIWLPKSQHQGAINYAFRSKLVFADVIQAINCPCRPGYMALLPKVTEEFISQLN